jgi:hypothetical protein
MKTLSCHRKYPITTNFLDTMLEHSVVIEEGETKLDAYRRGLKELDQIAAELRREANPGVSIVSQWDANYVPPPSTMTTAGNGPITIQMQKTPEDQRIAALIADIYSCTEIKVLESYKLMVRAHPALDAAYVTQMEKLSK